MTDLPGTTWIRFVVWLVVGLVIYVFYGYRHSRLRTRERRPWQTGTAVRHGGRVVVGYEGGATGHDALAFAGQWAVAAGDPMTVVTVHPGAAPLGLARVDAEWVAYERTEADALLDEAAGLVDPTASTVELPPGRRRLGRPRPLRPRRAGGRRRVAAGARLPARTAGCAAPSPAAPPTGCCTAPAAPVAVVPWGYADVEKPHARAGGGRVRRHPRRACGVRARGTGSRQHLGGLA